MKKLLTMVCVLSLIILNGCGQNKTNDNPSKEENKTNETDKTNETSNNTYQEDEEFDLRGLETTIYGPDGKITLYFDACGATVHPFQYGQMDTEHGYIMIGGGLNKYDKEFGLDYMDYTYEDPKDIADKMSGQVSLYGISDIVPYSEKSGDSMYLSESGRYENINGRNYYITEGYFELINNDSYKDSRIHFVLYCFIKDGIPIWIIGGDLTYEQNQLDYMKDMTNRFVHTIRDER